MRLRNMPTRLATGAYILHAGWEKWHGNEAQAVGVHGMASGAFPMFKEMPATDFLKTLSVGEMAVGAALVAAARATRDRGRCPDRLLGRALDHVTETDGMHKPGSIWPTHRAPRSRRTSGCSGIGLGLIVDGTAEPYGPLTDRPRTMKPAEVLGLQQAFPERDQVGYARLPQP